MAAGRKNAPATLKLLHGRGHGTDSGGRKVGQPPPFKRLPPEAPGFLGVVARATWERVVPELSRLELLKPVDGPALAAYCEMVETFVAATEIIHEEGLIAESTTLRKDGTTLVRKVAHPAVTVQRNAQAAIRAWCAEFGLSPAGEMKLVTSNGGSGDDDDNPFAGGA